MARRPVDRLFGKKETTSGNFSCLMQGGRKIEAKTCLEFGSAFRQNQKFCVKCQSPYKLCPICILKGLVRINSSFIFPSDYKENLVAPGTDFCHTHRGGDGNFFNIAKEFHCPAYNTTISKERCLNNCSHPRQNEEVCFTLKCASPWRLCLHCVRQRPPNFSFKEEKNIILCGVTSPRSDSCGFHEKDQARILDFFALSDNKEQNNTKEEREEMMKKGSEQFKNLTHYGRVELIRGMLAEDGSETVAKKLGVSEALVGFYIQIMDLPKEILSSLEPDAQEKASLATIVKLSTLPEHFRKGTFKKIVENNLSTKEAVKLIKAVDKNSGGKRTKRGPYKKSKKNTLASAEPTLAIAKSGQAFSPTSTLSALIKLLEPAIEKVIIEAGGGFQITIEKRI